MNTFRYYTYYFTIIKQKPLKKFRGFFGFKKHQKLLIIS